VNVPTSKLIKKKIEIKKNLTKTFRSVFFFRVAKGVFEYT